jgi:hypothetical protein
MTYTYTLINNSEVSFNGAYTINDPGVIIVVPQPLIFTSGQTIVATGTRTITQNDLDNNITFVSSAVAHVHYGLLTIDSNVASCTLVAHQNPSIKLLINTPVVNYIVPPLGRQNAGDQLSYSGFVINNGNLTLDTVTIDCSQLGLVNYPIPGILFPGQTHAF